jgi:pilus assembly protein Flp/PilA
MRNTTSTLHSKIPSLRSTLPGLLIGEKGQDLSEYALVVALIAFAAAAGMSAVVTKIDAAFTAIGTKVETYTS